HFIGKCSERVEVARRKEALGVLWQKAPAREDTLRQIGELASLHDPIHAAAIVPKRGGCGNSARQPSTAVHLALQARAPSVLTSPKMTMASLSGCHCRCRAAMSLPLPSSLRQLQAVEPRGGCRLELFDVGVRVL